MSLEKEKGLTDAGREIITSLARDLAEYDTAWKECAKAMDDMTGERLRRGCRNACDLCPRYSDCKYRVLFKDALEKEEKAAKKYAFNSILSYNMLYVFRMAGATYKEIGPLVESYLEHERSLFGGITKTTAKMLTEIGAKVPKDVLKKI
ncbi:MAG: hypothetical protein LUB83_00065 [Prevotellaceae bacterium]|nr:hypothetical protein [Prevotellaceae bacterium]